MAVRIPSDSYEPLHKTLFCPTRGGRRGSLWAGGLGIIHKVYLVGLHLLPSIMTPINLVPSLTRLV